MLVSAAIPAAVVPFAVQNSDASVGIVLLALVAMVFLVVKSFSTTQNRPPPKPRSTTYRPVNRRPRKASPKRPKASVPAKGKVRTIKGYVHVIDGDTVVISRTKVRLAGIDAPELDQPWGVKSKWAMVDICKGSVITAHLHGEMSYDREVGTAYLPDGRDIGAEIIKRGLALDYTFFSGGKYRHLEPVGVRHRITTWRNLSQRG